MSVIRELAIKLGLDVDAASFAEGALAAEAVKKGLELIVEAAVKTVEFLVDVGKEAIEVASALNDTSQAIGVTTDALQELQYAGGLAGVSAQEMTQAITILSKTMAKAKAGGEEQAKAFASIGVKVKDATGKLRPAEDVMGDIADHFKAMPDGAEKTAKAVELFGRAGARMISMLNEGGEGLAELRQEAHDLGLVMDEDTIKLGDDVGDNIDRLKGIFQAIKIQAGAALFPVLKRITTSIIDWVKVNKDLIRQRLDQMIRTIARAAEVLVGSINVLWGALKLIYAFVESQLAPILKLIAYTFDELGVSAKAAAIVFAAAWVVSLAPILAVVAGIAQVLLFLNSVQRFREGRDSIFGDWMKMLSDWAKPSANDAWWLAQVKELVSYLQEALGIAEKLGVAVDKVQKPFDSNTRTVAKAGAGAIRTAIGGATGDSSWVGGVIGNSDFAKRFDAARAGGEGVFGGFAAGLGFGGGAGSTPSLPPGGGVLRAPVSQDNSRTYVIQQSPGQSAQEIVDLITQYDKDANDAAAAALE